MKKYQPCDQWLESKRRDFKSFDEKKAQSHNRYIVQPVEIVDVNELSSKNIGSQITQNINDKNDQCSDLNDQCSELSDQSVDFQTDIDQLHKIIGKHQQAYQKFTAQYPKYDVLRITYIKSLEKWLLLIEDKSSRKKSQNNYGVLWWDGKQITIVTTGDISHSENHYFKLETFTRDVDIPKQNYSLPDLTPYRNDNRTYLRSGDGKLCEQYQLNFEV